MNTINNSVNSMDPLNLKYSKGILIALLEKGKVNKKVLQPYASNTNTLDDVLDALEQSNLISKKQDVIGRRVYEISLTPKGIAVAKQLQKADEIASGAAIPKESITIEIPQGLHEQILRILKLDREERSEEEFILNAVRDKIERWKREHPGHP